MTDHAFAALFAFLDVLRGVLATDWNDPRQALETSAGIVSYVFENVAPRVLEIWVRSGRPRHAGHRLRGMSNRDESRMVVATGTGFPFRAYPWEGADEDGTIRWQMEYQQDKSGFWGPRGTFEERDGVFYWDGREFATVEEVLVYRDKYPGGKH